MKNKKPKLIVLPNGTKAYYLNGNLHREDGPAIEGANGSKEYYLNGKLHREDGPAIEGADGTKSYYLNGKSYSEREYWQELYKLGKITKKDLFLKLL